MMLIELEKSVAEPVSVAEAKAWARIERADEDAIVERLISAAREHVERETGRVLAARAFRLVVDAVPADGRLRVGRRPLGAVRGVRSYDEAGAETIHDAGTVTVDGEHLVVGEALRAGRVDIEFEAGGEAPEALVQAMLRIVAASYETRGLVDEAMQPAIVPAFAKALLAPFRPVRL